MIDLQTRVFFITRTLTSKNYYLISNFVFLKSYWHLISVNILTHCNCVASCQLKKGASTVFSQNIKSEGEFPADNTNTTLVLYKTNRYFYYFNSISCHNPYLFFKRFRFISIFILFIYFFAQNSVPSIYFTKLNLFSFHSSKFKSLPHFMILIYILDFPLKPFILW